MLRITSYIASRVGKNIFCGLKKIIPRVFIASYYRAASSFDVTVHKNYRRVHIVIVFWLAAIKIYRMYVSLKSFGMSPRYRMGSDIQTLKLSVLAIIFDTFSQNGLIRGHVQNICTWYTIVFPHSLQHGSGVPICLNFCLGVIKKQIMFFQQTSLQDKEFVEGSWGSQASVHISSVISLSHLCFIYSVECLFMDKMPDTCL